MLHGDLFAMDPMSLVEARTLCHAAAQWGSKAARANLAPEADDSHSNLGWIASPSGLVSHFLDADQRLQLGFSFLEHSLIWVDDGRVNSSFDLTAGSASSVQTWVDLRLSGAGLQTTQAAEMPYELPEADYGNFDKLKRQTATLGLWYASADTALNDVVEEFQPISTTRPVVRCWPHHFDIAALLVLEAGDIETARSIGIGLSPGDESYGEPYFYCSPWPAPDPETVATPRSPWRWHTDGFVSLVCPASALSVQDNLAETLRSAVRIAQLEVE